MNRRIDWIAVKDKQPKGSPIVFMYSESNNEYSCSHFVLSRGDIPVTHWHPLVPPGYYLCIKDLFVDNGIRVFTKGRKYGFEGEIKLEGLTIILNDLNGCHALDSKGMTEHFEWKGNK